MAISAKIDSIRQANGKIYLRVGKQEREFASRADVLDWGSVSVEEAKEFLVRVLIQEWQRRNPAGNNPGQITNVTITLDLNGSLNPVRFSS